MEDIKQIKTEMMEFKPNKLSYSLALLAILFNTLYIILALRSMTMDYKVGIVTLANIFITLVTFLAASRTKQYFVKWSIYFIVLGVFQIAQIGVLKKHFLTALNKTDVRNIGYFLVISGILAIICGIVGTIRSIRLNSYLHHKQN